MKHYGDIMKINGHEVEIVDVVCGGSPCQDLSVAGKRAGLAGERSGLFMEQIRIIKEMREHDRELHGGRTDVPLRPRYMVWENVPGAFSSGNPKGADFAAVLEETIKVVEPTIPNIDVPKDGWTKSGCYYDEMGRWSVAWRVHDAQFWGVPQRRKRISLVADFGGLSAPEILFERKGLQRYFDEGSAEGQGLAGDTQGGSDSAIGVDGYNQSTTGGVSMPIRGHEGRDNIPITLKVRGGVQRDSNGKSAGKGALIQTDLSGCLGATQDQTLFCLEGNGARPSHLGSGYCESETMYTLNATEQHSVAYGFDQGASRDVGELFLQEKSKTLSNGSCPGHHNGVCIDEGDMEC